MRMALFMRVAKIAAFLMAYAIFNVGFLSGQQVPEQLYSEMQWRMIGPFRAGKVNAVAGVPGNPGVYYFAADGGGILETTDGGGVWETEFCKGNVCCVG